MITVRVRKNLELRELLLQVLEHLVRPVVAAAVRDNKTGVFSFAGKYRVPGPDNAFDIGLFIIGRHNHI